MKKLWILLLVALVGLAPLGCEGEAEVGDTSPNGLEIDVD